MRPRPSLVLAVLVLIGTGQRVEASPITYDFTADINQGDLWWIAGPISGSFTIDADPTLTNGGVYEQGSDVSITLNGLSFPNPSLNLKSLLSAEEITAPTGESQLQLTLGGIALAGGPNGAGLSVDMNFYSPGGAEQLTNLRNVDFSASNAAPITLQGSTSAGEQIAYATITSIEPASAPEPGTLLIFAGLGLAAIVRRSRRRSPDRAGA